MKYITVILFTLFYYISFAQEICSNGKDDDNDGLIDLKDPECTCKDSLPTLSYLHNASFEDNSSCPDPSVGGLNYIPYWSGGSVYGPDFYNLNCEVNFFDNFGRNPSKPPLPLPNGNGYIGLENSGALVKGDKSYAATCLVNPLLSGLKYSFECYIGFSPDDTNRIFFKSPV